MTTPFDMGGGGFYDPALASIMATQPELLIPAFAAAGIPPPDKFPTMEESGVAFSNPPAAPQNPLMAQLQGSLVGRTFNPQLGDDLGGSYNPQGAAAVASQPQPQGVGFADYDPNAGSPFAPPMPQPRPAAPMGATATAGETQGNPFPTPIGSPATAQKGGSDLMKALSGVKAPPAPAVQKIDSPRIPGASALPQQSPLIGALINAMSGKGAAMPDILRLHQTLGGR